MRYLVNLSPGTRYSALIPQHCRGEVGNENSRQWAAGSRQWTVGRVAYLALLFVTFLFFVDGSAFAQSNPTQVEPNNSTGTPPFGSYGGQNENINLGTGNLNISLPLFSFGARGMGLSLDAAYDSKVWHPFRFFDDITGQYIYDWDGQEVGGIALGANWRIGLPYLTSVVKTGSGSPPETWNQDFVVTTSDGGRHKFWNTGTRATMRKRGDTNDGSMLHINVSVSTDVVVRSADGMEIHFPRLSDTFPSYLVDRNGNKIVFNGTGNGGFPASITDVAGRTVVSFAYTAFGFLQSMTVADSDGVSRVYSFTQQNLTKPNVTFANPPKTINASGYYLTSFSAPSGQSYSFEYNDYSELTRISYPTGGSTTYAYAASASKHYYEDGGEDIADFREVTSRTRANTSLPTS